MIVIIDYQMGNIKSVQHALDYLGYKVQISNNPEVIKEARGLILPGVGAFCDAIKVLKDKKLDVVIKQMVGKGMPFLGICLGMQLLFSYSEENGLYKGLDLIPGKVVRFPEKMRVPHLGWNQIQFFPDANNCSRSLFSGIKNNSYFYFLHSYYCIPDNKDVILTKTYYENDFASAVFIKNIFGVQFHPEKSSLQGLSLLKKFGEICNADYSGY